MKKIILLFLTFISLNAIGQNCDCHQYFEWVKLSIEENDAGAKHTIENKGIELYNLHNLYFQEKIKKANELNECTKLISEWLLFFRKGHIGLYINSLDDSTNQSLNIKNFKPKTEKERECSKKRHKLTRISVENSKLHNSYSTSERLFRRIYLFD